QIACLRSLSAGVNGLGINLMHPRPCNIDIRGFDRRPAIAWGRAAQVQKKPSCQRWCTIDQHGNPGYPRPITSRGDGAMWQRDGWGQPRIGVLTPHADIVPEAEFSALAPDGISIHAARVPFGGYRPGGMMDPTIADNPVRAIADPPAIDDAAEMLAMAPLHAIVFGFTSSSYVRGAADDATLKSRLEARTRG